MEERELGEELKERGRSITPTLIRYADRNEYIALTREAQIGLSSGQDASSPYEDCKAELVHYDPQAESKLVAALLYRFSGGSYDEIWQRVEAMTPTDREAVVHSALDRLGPHDIPVRELEVVDYTFDLVMGLRRIPGVQATPDADLHPTACDRGPGLHCTGACH